MINFDQMARNILWEFQNIGVPSTGTPSQPTAVTQTNQTTTAQTSATSTGDDDAQTKQEQASLFGFLTANPPGYFSKLQQLWRGTFPSVYKFCTEDELNSLCYNVASSLPRTTKTPEKFPNIESIYPLLDLIAQLYEFNYKKGSNNSTANDTYKKVIDNIVKQKKLNPNLKPLDYSAINPWVQSIKSTYLATARQELGKLRLESQDDKSSIYQLIFNLLAIRKKSMLLKLPQAIRTISGEAIVKEIMLKPWNLISNKPYPINDEKLRVVYDSTTSLQLVNLSLAAYKLYQQQAKSLLKEVDETDTEARYALFMGVAGAEPMQWKVGGGTFDTASFDQSFELLSKTILNEAGQNDVDTRTPAERMRDIKDNVNASHMANRTSRFRNFATQITQASTDEEILNAIKEKIKDPKFRSEVEKLMPTTTDNETTEKAFDQITQASTDEEILNAIKEKIKDPNFASQLQDLLDKEVLNATEEKIKDPKFRSEVEKLMPTTTDNETTEKAFETGKGTNTFVYSFEKLKEAKAMFKNEEAANLLKELRQFADFIKKQDPSTRDIMGGLSQIAQGLTLGVKNAWS